MKEVESKIEMRELKGGEECGLSKQVERADCNHKKRAVKRRVRVARRRIARAEERIIT